VLKPAYEDVHRDMSALAASVRGYYRQKPDYRGLNTKLVISENLAPSAMKRRESIVSPIGRPVTVGANSDGDVVMPSGRQFVLSIDAVGRKVCRALSQTIGLMKTDPSFDSFTIENGEEVLTFGWSGERTFDKLAKGADRFCRDRNILSWRFN
jgi:hypothetical protein